jgi:hypothetical protein
MPHDLQWLDIISDVSFIIGGTIGLFVLIKIYTILKKIYKVLILTHRK